MGWALIGVFLACRVAKTVAVGEVGEEGVGEEQAPGGLARGTCEEEEEGGLVVASMDQGECKSHPVFMKLIACCPTLATVGSSLVVLGLLRRNSQAKLRWVSARGVAYNLCSAPV